LPSKQDDHVQAEEILAHIAQKEIAISVAAAQTLTDFYNEAAA